MTYFFNDQCSRRKISHFFPPLPNENIIWTLLVGALTCVRRTRQSVNVSARRDFNETCRKNLSLVAHTSLMVCRTFTAIECEARVSCDRVSYTVRRFTVVQRVDLEMCTKARSTSRCRSKRALRISVQFTIKLEQIVRFRFERFFALNTSLSVVFPVAPEGHRFTPPAFGTDALKNVRGARREIEC